MHDNRNKEVIKRVEKGMMKANRTRNIFAIVAVALTTFMITTVFSLGINYKENMELTSVRTSVRMQMFHLPCRQKVRKKKSVI